MFDRHARRRHRPADPRRRPADGYRTLTTRRFRSLVADGLTRLPTDLRPHVEGARIQVEDLPPPGDGVELVRFEPGTDRPDGRARLTLYRRPLEARATDRDDLILLVTDVVAEELDERLGPRGT